MYFQLMKELENSVQGEFSPRACSVTKWLLICSRVCDTFYWICNTCAHIPLYVSSHVQSRPQSPLFFWSAAPSTRTPPWSYFWAFAECSFSILNQSDLSIEDRKSAKRGLSRRTEWESAFLVLTKKSGLSGRDCCMCRECFSWPITTRLILFWKIAIHFSNGMLSYKLRRSFSSLKLPFTITFDQLAASPWAYLTTVNQ